MQALSPLEAMSELSNGVHITMAWYYPETYSEGICILGGFSLQKIKLPDNKQFTLQVTHNWEIKVVANL